MIERVIVGIDFTEGSRAALLEGERLAEQFDVPCLAVHVLPSTIAVFPDTFAFHVDPAWYEMEDRASAEQLAEWVSPLPKATGKVIKGPPARQLVGSVDSNDLLVMGHERHSHLSDLLFGSTTRWVLDHAPCPVLIVPTPPGPVGKEAEH